MSKLFDSKFLQKLERISLHANLALDGSMSGNRKSRSRGSSVEFSDYREYASGDDFRRIDWNAYGRFEKLFIKLFMEEREAPVTIFVDVSKSMNWGEPNKSIASRKLAAALAYMSLSNFDRVSMVCIDDGIRAECRDIRGKNFFYKITDMLEKVQFTGQSDIKKAVEAYQMKANRGISVLISDFFSEGSFDELMKYLRYKKQEVYICNILSPQELKPDINESVRLIDSETNKFIDITMTPSLLNSYEKTLNSFLAEMEQTGYKWGANFFKFSSLMSVEKMIVGVAEH